MQIIWCFLWKAQITSKSIAKASKIFDANDTYGKRILADWISSDFKILLFLDLRRFSDVSSSKSPVCFFCDNTASTEKGSLHLVQSFRLDQRVRRCANVLEDSYLHAKLQNGDIIAQDAMYHKVCLSNLYRSASYK